MAGEAEILSAVAGKENQMIGGLGGLATGIGYGLEARRLAKERKRLLAEGAPGLSDLEKQELERAQKRYERPLTPEEEQQYAASQARAASVLAPGYSQEMQGIAQQQADVLAAGKRGSATSSNLLNLLGRMNAQGQAQRRQLAMRGEQAQRAAQGELGRQTGYIGGVKRGAQENLQNLSMLADARREQRKRLWESQLAAMDKAAREYRMGAIQAPFAGYMNASSGQTPSIPSTGGGGNVSPSAGTPQMNYYKQYSGGGSGMGGFERGMYGPNGIDPYTGMPYGD